MDAVVFSSYLPGEDRLYIGKQFLDVFKAYFSDCDIYVGINPDTTPLWPKLLEEYKKDLNISYAHVPPELYTRSDPSGYQAALKLLRNTNKEYDLVWFGHTKGGHYNDQYRAETRQFMIDIFWSKRKEISKKLEDSPECGSYGPVMTVTLTPGKADVMDHYYKKFKYKSTDLSYLYTFYTIKGNIIYEFVHNCEDCFFEDNLHDHYFFEDYFPQVSPKMGYEQLYGSLQNFPKNNIVTRERILKIQAGWKRAHGL